MGGQGVDENTPYFALNFPMNLNLLHKIKFIDLKKQPGI